MILEPNQMAINKHGLVLQYLTDGRIHYNKCIVTNGTWKVGESKVMEKKSAYTFDEDTGGWKRYYSFNDYLNQIDK